MKDFKNSPVQEGKQILTDQIRVISLEDWSPGEYKEQQTKHRCVAVCALTVNVDEKISQQYISVIYSEIINIHCGNRNSTY